MTGLPVDEKLLAEAQWHLAEESGNAVINEALRCLVERERAKRQVAVELAREMLDDGRLEFRVLRSLDGELLDEAQRQISAASPELAISEALRRLVEQERDKRRAARLRFEQMYDEGAFSCPPTPG